MNRKDLESKNFSIIIAIFIIAVLFGITFGIAFPFQMWVGIGSIVVSIVIGYFVIRWVSNKE